MTTLAVILASVIPGQIYDYSYEYGGTIRAQEVKYQKEVFQRHWGEELVWRFDDLPTYGTVPPHRIPYAGYIYPDRGGGTALPLSKYDRAFHRGRSLAVSFEHLDIVRHSETVHMRAGRFGRRMITSSEVPHWAGHCNGWTAAAIRHAEPMKNVTRNGVVFTPADIKGLMAELYIYSETEFLGGLDYTINPGLFHVVVANWLGRKSHPIGMEITPGKEVWNYPAYRFNTVTSKRGDRAVEVKMRLTYQGDTRGEPNRAPQNKRAMYFHYLLNLNAQGEIVGGTFYPDSSQIDMLWVPLQPTQGGKKGNTRGNPYLDVNLVLDLWRDSVSPDIRDKWANIDPRPSENGVRLVAEGTPSQPAVAAAGEGDE